MSIDKGIKKKVIKDWQNAFPDLTLYGQNKLYKIVGPIVIGLEFINSSNGDTYRPYFVMYPLWEADLKTSLGAPFVLKVYYNKKGLQYSIPYKQHDALFSDAAEYVKKQTPLYIDNNISLRSIFSVIDEYSQIPPLSAAANSYLQAVLQEAKMKISLFISVTVSESVLGQISNRNWDKTHFKSCGVDLVEWLKSLQTTISSRDEFLNQIENNKQSKKICKLKTSRLTE